MDSIRLALQSYIAIRQNLGYKFQQPAKRLKDFVTFLEHQNATCISVKLALKWALQSQPADSMPAIRLSDVRGFAAFLHAIDPCNEIPPAGLMTSYRRKQPYLYHSDEIEKLVTAAIELPPHQGLRRWTYRCLFGLLAVTGMRMSEAINLKNGDVDLDNGVLTVTETKFGQSRLIPLHPSTTLILRQYQEKRDSHLRQLRSPFFLVAEKGGRIWLQQTYVVFHQLCKNIGLTGTPGRRSPRPIDLRHSFAVSTLLQWYRDDQNINAALPVLATYLGHRSIRDTYWYLSACPELLNESVKRLEARWETSL